VLRVGLTGGIACGKSRVRRRLAAAGFATLDLDLVAHELIAPGGAAYADVVAAFGPGILAADGSVDRKALGARVFADAAARAQLNALVHPRVRDEEARRAAEEEARGTRVMVTDAALLVEAGLHLRFDRLVVVDCEGGEQVRRLMARDGVEEAAARARIAAQMPAAEKRRFAHILLDASGSLAETDAHADALATELAARADRPPPRPSWAPEPLLAALALGPREGPRGLDPAALVRDVAGAGAVEMNRLARLLVPPFDGPWHAAADAMPAAEPGPDALALAVGLWSRARRGEDDAFTAAAMFSVARLTHREPARIADAVLVALAAAHAGARERGGPEEIASWSATARRWADADTTRAAPTAVSAGWAQADPVRAGATAAATGGDPLIARGLAAARAGTVPHGLPPDLVEAVRALG
jgi:dephospho-CoA kinase